MGTLGNNSDSSMCPRMERTSGLLHDSDGVFPFNSAAIKILQSILLRTCLILGVKVHSGVSFRKLIEPANANSGWTVQTTPSSCPITSYHFDVIIGADGKQNSLPGFHSKEFRAKLALAITVNFVNSFTKQEAAVPEISGVAYVYRQDFFNDLADKHGISLENIVYFKDETHYLVMTAKKQSLLEKGVLKKVKFLHTNICKLLLIFSGHA